MQVTRPLKSLGEGCEEQRWAVLQTPVARPVPLVSAAEEGRSETFLQVVCQAER